MKRLLIALCALIFVVAPAFAVNPDEMLADPALEARARAISENVRCLVCQNQSIDDSDADLAADLRVLVRERLVAGDTNDEVIQYLVDRYGEFVLLNPVVAWHTLALWIAAPVIFLIGLAALISNGRKIKRIEGAGMTHQEEAALKKLVLADDEQDDQPAT